MNLAIPQTQLFTEVTLGILGVEEICIQREGESDASFRVRRSHNTFGTFDNRVHFILRFRCSNSMANRFAQVFNQIFGKEPTLLITGERDVYMEAETTFLFSFNVEGKLRNPIGYLRAIARKIREAFEEAFKRAEQDDREVEHLAWMAEQDVLSR
jgi:hypothetical protein